MIDKSQVQSLLRSMQLFSSCEESELSQIAGRFHEVHYEPRAVVSPQGVADDRFFVVVDGTLYARHDGKLVRRVEEGDYIGEMALLTETDRHLEISVSRRRDATLLELRKNDFDRILSENPKILKALARSLAERLAAAERREVVVPTPWIGVVAQPGMAGSSLVAETLAGLLRGVSGRGDAVAGSARRGTIGASRCCSCPSRSRAPPRPPGCCSSPRVARTASGATSSAARTSPSVSNSR